VIQGTIGLLVSNANGEVVRLAGPEVPGRSLNDRGSDGDHSCFDRAAAECPFPAERPIVQSLAPLLAENAADQA